jgi:hypothetical protein
VLCREDVYLCVPMDEGTEKAYSRIIMSAADDEGLLMVDGCGQQKERLEDPGISSIPPDLPGVKIGGPPQ